MSVNVASVISCENTWLLPRLSGMAANGMQSIIIINRHCQHIIYVLLSLQNVWHAHWNFLYNLSRIELASCVISLSSRQRSSTANMIPWVSLPIMSHTISNLRETVIASQKRCSVGTRKIPSRHSEAYAATSGISIVFFWKTISTPQISGLPSTLNRHLTSQLKH